MGEKRLITTQDLLQIKHLEDPQLSPDGRYVAYLQSQPNATENNYTTNIWLIDIEGKQSPLQLTRGNKDSQPRWSPKGDALAFVSGRSGFPQLFLLPMSGRGGEAYPITTHINGVSQPSWSADGALIAFLGKMNAEERTQEDAGTAKRATPEERNAFFDPMVITHIPYREGVNYLDNRYSQIYTVRIADQVAKRVTHIDAHYTAPVWSPDGNRLYSTRIAEVGGDEYWRRGSVFEIDLVSGTETRLLDDEYTLMDLGISPNGEWLTMNRRSGTDAISLFQLVACHIKTGKERVLNASIDRVIAPHAWTSEGAVLMVAQTEGRCHIYQAHPDFDGAHLLIAPDLFITGISAGKDGSIAVTASHSENPSNLFYSHANQASLTRLTDINRAFLDEVQVQPTHELRYTHEEGVAIQGWYILPPDYDEAKTYPLAVNIHGGPHVMWSHHERGMWHEWQTHAAQGYVVFYCNPRGSEGYGDAFIKALGNQWGNIAMADIMAGVNTLIEQGIADKERLAITGGSYGGYMVAWIIAHTDVFKSAVTQRGVYNVASFYGTTDIPTFAKSEFGVAPYEDPAFLWERSPLAYAKNMNTPLLIIHSENDFRVPIEQGEQLFTHLHRMGKTVRFVRFPREGHELSRSGEPTHRIRRIQEMVEWWNKFIKAD